ncbi:MAG TPA: hypothetical protein VHG08_19300 [Longimicrobium sp.]|nr:hypothetical protein [Longimicrobium sp.]
MSSPTKQQSIVYQVAMYAGLVDNQKGSGLEAALYADIQAAMKANAAQIGDWSVAWGPVVVQFDTTSYDLNAMYVAESQDTPGTYVLGIAGTNPYSIFDWLVEDGLVSKQLPWPYALLSAPDAKISLGTGIGLAILQNAVPVTGIPGAGTTVLKFLQDIPDKQGMNLIVAGHSLGGALSATVTLWLHDIRLLWDPFHQVALSSIPTAGPTAGNGAFAQYSNGAIQLTRFANAIDVVPHAWQASDLAKIPTLYVPSIDPDPAVEGLVALAEQISAAGDYTQLVNDTGWFPFDVDTSLINPDDPAIVNFVAQLAWQHTTAYLRYFNVESPQLEAWAADFQARAVAQAPSAALGGAAQAAAKEVTAPVGGVPTVIPPASDPRSDEIAARVLADLMRSATPEQQQVTIPVDPQRLADAPSAAGPA